jgi:hypothetical protein
VRWRPTRYARWLQVSFVLQPRPQALADDAGQDEPTRRAKDLASLCCVSKRFAHDFKHAISRVVRCAP